MERPIGEELILELPKSLSADRLPAWTRSRPKHIPLRAQTANYLNCEKEYRNPSEFFGGYKHEFSLEIDMGSDQELLEIQTYPTGASRETKVGAPAGGMLASGLRPFFEKRPDMAVGDRLHFTRTAPDRYKMWIEKKTPQDKSSMQSSVGENIIRVQIGDQPEKPKEK